MMDDKEVETVIKNTLNSFLRFYKGYNTGLQGRERRQSISILKEVINSYLKYVKQNKPINMHDQTMKDIDEGKITMDFWNS